MDISNLWPMLQVSIGAGGDVRANGGGGSGQIKAALGCKMRDVESTSVQITQKFDDEEFAIQPSRLPDIETVPSIYRLYALAAISPGTSRLAGLVRHRRGAL